MQAVSYLKYIYILWEVNHIFTLHVSEWLYTGVEWFSIVRENTVEIILIEWFRQNDCKCKIVNHKLRNILLALSAALLLLLALVSSEVLLLLACTDLSDASLVDWRSFPALASSTRPFNRRAQTPPSQLVADHLSCTNCSLFRQVSKVSSRACCLYFNFSLQPIPQWACVRVCVIMFVYVCVCVCVLSWALSAKLDAPCSSHLF